MDALEFVKYAKKMCKQYGETKNSDWCEGCPALNEEDICIANFQYDLCDPNKAVEAVEKYAKEYPIETNQDRFLKVFPEVEKSCGIIDICPKTISKEYRNNKNRIEECNMRVDCNLCRKEFWLSEAE